MHSHPGSPVFTACASKALCVAFQPGATARLGCWAPGYLRQATLSRHDLTPEEQMIASELMDLLEADPLQADPLEADPLEADLLQAN